METISMIRFLLSVTEMDIQIRSHTPDLGVAPSGIDFNPEVDKSVRIILEHARTPSDHTTTPHQITSWADAFGDSDNELGDDADDIVEDDWLPLQGKGSSKLSKEFDGTPMWCNLSLIALHSLVSEITD
ncbi:hypothetical protein FNV43_RR10998 [Rhamnella rubrinervis]|uniref:Uncharacterized protein n=1 Tax=Rhamnella rubrinervis TaxID=2594499 RepID=A0A8K0MH81_9ROSA|nr:hypothetical protein FNV43_RR10998 [Rhamnella rubrinervis]